MELRALLILTENHTLVDPRDVGGLVEMAIVADDTGVDAVMISEHVALGPTANALGRPENPRAYAAPGNQDPAMAWPSTIALAGAVAAATSRVRIVLGAIITPLRHPVVLAKELATLDLLSKGRLVVQPTVSWHRDEYDALGVPFEHRGEILDEQLEVLAALWAPSPASHSGRWFAFTDVWSEPKPYRPGGPAMWFGGQRLHSALLDRLVRFGQGFHPFGTPTAAELVRLDEALVAAGRDPTDVERVGGTRARFVGADDVADLGEAMAAFPQQVAAGYTTFCMKPSQHTDDVTEVPALCRRLVAYLDSLAATAVRPSHQSTSR